ncbi:MAG: GDP-mannose 4,6-dehydratase [Gemmatimonadota bacterium]|nr:GDP-mannose 4,6-dehydratase [Gemmatimonadota bacterium]
MKALITGGAGFIGSHLARRLVARGDSVVVLDDLSTGAVANLRDLRSSGLLDFHVGCVGDRPLVTELMDDCDVTFHLAAAVGVRLIVEQPVHTIQTNVHGTQVVLEAAAKKRKAVVVASTSEVYGKSHDLPFRETADITLGSTTNSRWAYACSKALDEWLALAYWQERKVPTIICRFFNTVGPGQSGRYGMVLPNFARQALAGDPITVFGTGEQSRCFGHVYDTVEALLRLVETPEAVGEVVNIGSTEEVSIYELAVRVREAASSSSEIAFVSYQDAYREGFEDMQRRLPDVSKLEALTGFHPSIPLSTIVGDVLADQEDRMTTTGTVPAVSAGPVRARPPVRVGALTRASA